MAVTPEGLVWKGRIRIHVLYGLCFFNGTHFGFIQIVRMSTLDSKAKSNTLVGKMKKFVKAKSIEETPAAEKLMISGSQVGFSTKNYDYQL